MTGLIIKVDITGEEHALDETVKIAIFRIIQEALNNIIKHARAGSVSVSMDYKEKSAYILVRDNGIGFDMDAVKNRIGRVSLGLAGMAERAALLGGTVEVHSRPDYGTEVEAVIPYQAVKKEE
ncbi:MAG: ATP-binding protein, partial [Anaerolineales bacterium]|nr:ATP-binding protein [Anaerolineales bacterium]